MNQDPTILESSGNSVTILYFQELHKNFLNILLSCIELCNEHMRKEVLETHLKTFSKCSFLFFMVVEMINEKWH